MNRLVAVACVAASLIGAPASGEVYRWTDASGVVHYTSDIHQVPASQRDLARAAIPSGRGSLQRADARPSVAPTSRPPAASPAAAADDVVEGKSEAQWRAEAERLRARVALYSGPLGRCENDTLRISARSSREHIREEAAEANACAETKRAHGFALTELADFEERAHRLGVPPGWIRE